MTREDVRAEAGTMGWPGLCRTCRHAHRIENARGSTFWRCRLADTDARFPRYPVLPVLACAGHEPMELDGTGARLA